MIVAFRRSFVKDTKALNDPKIRKRLEQVILEVESATHLGEVSGVLAMTGFPNAFRIRLGNYRIGIVRNGVAVEFVRFLDRKDIYKYFP